MIFRILNGKKMADQTQNGNAFEFAVYSMFESTLNDWLRQSRLGPSIVTPISSGRGVAMKKAPIIYAKYFRYCWGIFPSVKRENL